MVWDRSQVYRHTTLNLSVLSRILVGWCCSNSTYSSLQSFGAYYLWLLVRTHMLSRWLNCTNWINKSKLSIWSTRGTYWASCKRGESEIWQRFPSQSSTQPSRATCMSTFWWKQLRASHYLSSRKTRSASNSIKSSTSQPRLWSCSTTSTSIR